jgi:hypothetical protein
MAHLALRTVWDYAEKRLDLAVRKIRNKLRRFPASRIFEGEARHRWLWYEFCFDRHRGPHELLEEAFEQTIFPFCVEAAQKCSDEQIGLLWFSTEGYFNFVDPDAKERPAVSQMREDVAREVWSRLVRLATDAELDEL